MDDTLTRQFAALQFGDHLCRVYDEVAEALAVAAPFIAQGLTRGERCVYIRGEHPVDQIASALTAAGVDVPREEGRGSLELLPSWIVPFRPGELRPEIMVDFMGQKVTEAVENGFSGLRVVGEMTWLIASGLAPHHWTAYESRLTNLFAERPIVAICLYNRQRFPPPILRDVLLTHPLAILDELVCPNIYYQPPDLFLGRRSVSRQVAWMMEQLRRARQVEEEHARLIRERAERTEAERALQRVRTILESISDGFYAVDPGWRYLYVNRQGADLVGTTPDELIGRNIWDVFPEAVGSPFYVAAHRALSEQTRVDLEQIWASSSMPVEFRIYPSPEGLTIFCQDISERKRGEEVVARLAALERQRTESLNALTRIEERERIAMDLHDGVVQSLYAVALGLARLELMDVDIARLRTGVALAQGQIGQVIEDIRGYLQVLPERAPPTDGLWSRVEALIQDFGIAGLTRLHPRVPSPALVDAEAVLGPDAIEDVVQVARDALANAARHAEATEVTVRLDVLRNRLGLTVRDNGRGFDQRSPWELPSHGLRNIAERSRRLGGRLEVTSQPGRGTRVRLSVPLSANQRPPE